MLIESLRGGGSVSPAISKYTYKDVVFTQQATGVWSAKVLELTSYTKTLKDLLSQNSTLHSTIAAMKLSAENTANVWYTLVGLKLLKENFKDNKLVWKLIANKAKQALGARLGFTGDLKTALGQLDA
jgi:hypothetical protein